MIFQRPPFTIHHFAKLGSTNDLLKEMSDAPEFTCIVADEQTAGRGRRDRSWHSSPGEGLYLSILLRPSNSTAKIPLLSLMSAVAVAETLMNCGATGVDIKWPNDVLVNERKLCGILVEGVSARENRMRIIVGIGVNLNHQSFPDELNRIATSWRIETGTPTSVDEFRDQLLSRLAHWYECWKRDETDLILDRWQRLSSYGRGQQVTVTLDQELVSGETAGLNEDGALLLRTNDGRVRTILAGDVTKVRRHDVN